MSTVVTGTLVDSKGRIWANAPVQLTFSPAFGTPGPFEWSGGVFNKMPPTIYTDNLGHFNITVPANNEIIPANTSWFITIGPNATLPAIVLNVSLITGSLDISALFTARATPGLAQSFPIPRAYNDSDVIVPPNSGQLYYNVTSKALKYYEDGAWQPVSGGGGSMVYPPVGVAVSGGSFWQDSIPQANIPLLDALNIFTQPIFTPAVISQGDLVLEGAGKTRLNWDAGTGVVFGDGVGVLSAAMNPDGTMYTRALWAYNTGASIPSSVLLDYLPGSGNGVGRLLSSSTDLNPGSFSFAGVNNAGGNFYEYMHIHGETPAPYVQIIADLSVEPFGAAQANIRAGGAISAAKGFLTNGTYGGVPSFPSVMIDWLPADPQGRIVLFGDATTPTVVPKFSIIALNSNQSNSYTYFQGNSNGTVTIPPPLNVGGALTTNSSFTTNNGRCTISNGGGDTTVFTFRGATPTGIGRLVLNMSGSDGSGIIPNGEFSGGNLYINGSISCGGTKAFRIPNPLDETKDLIHACLEGPENGVYYRGEVVTQDGVAEVTLPDYFEALTFTEDRSVQLTLIVDEAAPIFGGQVAAGRIKNGKFKVFSTDATATIAWEVKAVRKLGVDRLKVERLKTESL